MSDEERAELEAMRAREAEWEAHLEEQEQRMRKAQEHQWQQQEQAEQMRAQWEEMKGQVHGPAFPKHPFRKRTPWTVLRLDFW
jgi:hypothetical protein